MVDYEDKHIGKCDKDNCIVCESWKKEKEEQARRFLIDRTLRSESENTSDSQTTILNYE